MTSNSPASTQPASFSAYEITERLTLNLIGGLENMDVSCPVSHEVPVYRLMTGWA